MQITTYSADETQALGKKLAESLRPGDVIAYFGDLGAGKTAFTRGIAEGLGVSEQVTSPTYTIVNEYLSGRLPLFHFDIGRTIRHRLGGLSCTGRRVRRRVERKCRRRAAGRDPHHD